jgi:hypothetical protein
MIMVSLSARWQLGFLWIAVFSLSLSHSIQYLSGTVVMELYAACNVWRLLNLPRTSNELSVRQLAVT